MAARIGLDGGGRFFCFGLGIFVCSGGCAIAGALPRAACRCGPAAAARRVDVARLAGVAGRSDAVRASTERSPMRIIAICSSVQCSGVAFSGLVLRKRMLPQDFCLENCSSWKVPMRQRVGELESVRELCSAHSCPFCCTVADDATRSTKALSRLSMDQ